MDVAFHCNNNIILTNKLYLSNFGTLSSLKKNLNCYTTIL